ncbi:MAG: hypothetical protein ACYDG3_11850 [Bacillati bacterium]
MTVKQALRQPFGYYMENIFSKYLESLNIPHVAHILNHLDEMPEEWKIIEKLSGQFFHNLFTRPAWQSLYCEDHDWPSYIPKDYNIDVTDDAGICDSESYGHYVILQPFIESLRTKHSGFDAGHMELELLQKIAFTKNWPLYEAYEAYYIQQFVRSNTFELIYFPQNEKPIIAEIKSKWQLDGSKEDYRMYFEQGQIDKFIDLSDCQDIDLRIIRIVALPETRYIEIPFDEIELKDGKYQMIPSKYRDTDSWKIISKQITGFSNVHELVSQMHKKWPNNDNISKHINDNVIYKHQVVLF